jgi:hypothetical protein
MYRIMPKEREILATEIEYLLKTLIYYYYTATTTTTTREVDPMLN